MLLALIISKMMLMILVVIIVALDKRKITYDQDKNEQ